MSDQWTVSELMHILVPRIEDAYRQIAPEHPTQVCYIVLPVPAPLFDSEALAQEFGRALAAEKPFVRNVEYMPPGHPITLGDGEELSSPPGVVVYFHPWSETQGAA